MTSGKGFDGVDPPEFMNKVTHLTEKEDSKELRKWEPFETMVICAEIPRPQQQGPRPTGPDGEPQSSEATRSYHQPLMFIKYTAGGELEIQPSFIDKETCFYHQFTTPIIDGVGGETYRYEIENVREVQKKKVHMLRLQQADAERFRLERFQNQVGTNFRPKPLPGEHHTHIFGEVTSAEGFEANQLYLELFVGLPQGWEPRQGSDDYITHHEVSTQFTRQTQTGEGALSKWHFGFPFELDLHRRKEAGPVRTPRVYMCVNSVDSWSRHHVEGYGYVDVPSYAGMHDLRVHTWKPQGTVREQMRNFYLGGALQLGAVNYPPLSDKLPGRVMNQHGFRTESSGYVNLRCQIVIQHCRPPTRISHGEHGVTRRKAEAAYNEAEEGEQEHEELEMREALVARATKRLEEHKREREAREARQSARKTQLTRSKSLAVDTEATSPMSFIAKTSPLKKLGHGLIAASRGSPVSTGGPTPRARSPRDDSQSLRRSASGLERRERGERGERPEREPRTSERRPQREPRGGEREPRSSARRERGNPSPLRVTESAPEMGAPATTPLARSDSAPSGGLPTFGQTASAPPEGDPNAPPESPGSEVEWGSP